MAVTSANEIHKSNFNFCPQNYSFWAFFVEHCTKRNFWAREAFLSPYPLKFLKDEVILTVVFEINSTIACTNGPWNPNF